mmetsp:Transcript_86967/g.153755  ORF Transcript_86967/g.153755 Transcript_86967/m.153755 type:complete len:154 (-) Transcript_86967:73-534(-)
MAQDLCPSHWLISLVLCWKIICRSEIHIMLPRFVAAASILLFEIQAIDVGIEVKANGGASMQPHDSLVRKHNGEDGVRTAASSCSMLMSTCPTNATSDQSICASGCQGAANEFECSTGRCEQDSYDGVRVARKCVWGPILPGTCGCTTADETC